MLKMKIRPTSRLEVCGGSFPNEGDTIEIILSSGVTAEPLGELKKKKRIEILSSKKWQQEYEERGFYGGHGTMWHFPHEFYSRYPEIPFDIAAANEKADRKAEAEYSALPSIHKAIFERGIKFPIDSLRELQEAMKQFEKEG